jgi:hypothetical protein
LRLDEFERDAPPPPKAVVERVAGWVRQNERCLALVDQGIARGQFELPRSSPPPLPPGPPGEGRGEGSGGLGRPLPLAMDETANWTLPTAGQRPARPSSAKPSDSTSA